MAWRGCWGLPCPPLRWCWAHAGVNSTLLSLLTPVCAPSSCFCPHSSKWQFFWPLCILLSILCQDCAGTHLFLVLYSKYTSFLEEMFVQLQAMRKGSQVPGWLITINPLIYLHTSSLLPDLHNELKHECWIKKSRPSQRSTFWGQRSQKKRKLWWTFLIL